jgi:DNA-binding transcriptional ArsR family regulator
MRIAASRAMFRPMSADLKLANIASVLGDPARANMMMALMDGRALTAKELAYVARVTPQTASVHLARLRDLKLITVLTQGRNRFHRISSSQVADMIEAIARVGDVAPAAIQTRAGAALRLARTCYDHIAGQLGVAIADALRGEDYVRLGEDGGEVTERGRAHLERHGINLDPGRRMFCRPCLDWTERRFHIAGAVGAAICTHCLERGWVKRTRDTRALEVTAEGRRGLAEVFGVDVAALTDPKQAAAA